MGWRTGLRQRLGYLGAPYRLLPTEAEPVSARGGAGCVQGERPRRVGVEGRGSWDAASSWCCRAVVLSRGGLIVR